MDSLDDLDPINLRKATPEQLAKLKGLSDDDLLRSAGTLDICAVVEANRRLKNALITEEAAIKRLTFWLVILTAVLVLFGLADVFRHLVTWPF